MNRKRPINEVLSPSSSSESTVKIANYEETQITVVSIKSEPFEEDVKSLYTEVDIKHEPIEEPINTDVLQEDCSEINTKIIKEENDAKPCKEQPQEMAQFSITLCHIKPPIWRTIEFDSSISFADLHNIIQDAMGWRNCHLHDFEVYNPTTRVKDLIVDSESMDLCSFHDGDVHDEEETLLANYLMPKQKIVYKYDMGDGWIHELIFVGMVPSLPEVRYPRCIAGRRACPPEDCGGCGGYVSLLETLKNPKDPDYEEKFMWLEEMYPGFNPERFQAKEVIFSNAF